VAKAVCEHPSDCACLDQDDEPICAWCEDLERIKHLEETIKILREAIGLQSFTVPQNATLIVGDAQIGLIEVYGGTVQQGLPNSPLLGFGK